MDAEYQILSSRIDMPKPEGLKITDSGTTDEWHYSRSRIVVGGVESEVFEHEAGVLQGFIISPLLSFEICCRPPASLHSNTLIP